MTKAHTISAADKAGEGTPLAPSVTAPQDIEARSMEIIASLLPCSSLRTEELPVVMRIVHACGDLSVAQAIRFHKEALQTAMAVIKSGTWFVADVKMTLAGISRDGLRLCGCRAVCAISSAQVVREAARSGRTRASTAMRCLARELDGGVAVIGNAPTALRQLLALAEEGLARPALVIGMPVGFVDAAESKQALMESGLVWITVEGTRGGSAMAAAAVNALLRMARPTAEGGDSGG